MVCGVEGSVWLVGDDGGKHSVGFGGCKVDDASVLCGGGEVDDGAGFVGGLADVEFDDGGDVGLRVVVG